MNDDTQDEEYIINFTRNVWRTCFPNHTKAPLTLCYDPLSTFTGTCYGLCHIAHDNIYMSDFVHYDPDKQIYAIDPYNRQAFSPSPTDLTTSDIPNLPRLECIVFVSFDSLTNLNQLLEKLCSHGIAIVINECVKLPMNWIRKEIDIKLKFGSSISYGPEDQPSRTRLKEIKAFMKP